MSYLAVGFILLLDLVLVWGFMVFHGQLRECFYKRCGWAFVFECLATITLFFLEIEAWRPLTFTLLFEFYTLKGLMLWSAVLSLDTSKSHKWWIPAVFVGYCVAVIVPAVLGAPQILVAQIAILIPLFFNLAPAWALYWSRWISWKSFQLLFGCILLSQLLFNAGSQYGGLDQDFSMLLFYLGMVSNVFVGLSAFVVGMKRLQGRLEVALNTITSIQNQTEAIVKASMDSILITDLNGEIRFANPAANMLFVEGRDHPPNLFQQQFASESEDQPGFTLERIRDEIIVGANHFVRWNCVLNHDLQGEVPVEFTAVPIQNEEEHLLAVYIRDLREQRKNEAEIIRERDRAEQLNKQLSSALEQAQMLKDQAEHANAAKNDFLGVMSHELRTPLSAIIGMSSMLEEESLSPTQRQSVAAINDCGQSLLLIIGDILNYSRIEAGKIDLVCRPFQLRQCLEQVVDLMRNQCNHQGIHLLPVLHPNLPSYYLGDIGKVRRIITNLVSNAVKFTDAGHVSIEINPKKVEADQTEGIEMVIKDTGIGITEEQQNNLFEAFYQADYSASRRYSGTGLGLAICKRLTEAMGGEIHVQSALGAGSTFTVYLPLPVAQPADQEAQESPAELLRTFDRRIHYVNSYEPARFWMKACLDAYGISGACFDSLDALTEEAFATRNGPVLWVVDQQVMDQEEKWQSFLSTCKEQYGDGELPLIGTFDHPAKRMSSTTQSLPKPFFFEQLIRQAGKLNVSAQSSVKAPKSLSPKLSADPLMGLKVLVAEDHPINCKLARLYLAKLGCECVIVHDGNEALDAYAQQHFDAVLMDLHMPGMDGFETTKHLVDRRDRDGKRPYVIALTAGASSHEKAKAAEVGMNDFLLKPVQIEQLREALKRAVSE